MLRYLKDLLGGLKLLNEELAALVKALRDQQGDSLKERVDVLERSRAVWEGEMEGMVLKAKSQKNEARSAEERTKVLAKKAEKLTDDESIGGAAFEPTEQDIAAAHARFGDQGGVPALPEVLENGAAPRDSFENARARKWARR